MVSRRSSSYSCPVVTSKGSSGVSILFRLVGCQDGTGNGGKVASSSVTVRGRKPLKGRSDGRRS